MFKVHRFARPGQTVSKDGPASEPGGVPSIKEEEEWDAHAVSTNAPKANGKASGPRGV